MDKLISKPQAKSQLIDIDKIEPDSIDEAQVLKDIDHFCKSSCIDNIKLKLHLQKKISKFTKKMTIILKAISKESLEKKFRIVMQSCEDYILADNKVKHGICLQLLKHVLNHDENLTMELIEMFAHSI